MMNFVLQTLLLQHVAQVNIVAQMWNHRDIFTQIVHAFNSSRSFLNIREILGKLKEIEEKVESKVSALPLPASFKEQLLNLIKPMGIEIVNWCSYYCGKRYNFKFLDIFLLNQVCWTMRGTVDYAKTAEVIVKDERVDIVKRYEFACINCLEEEARKLFTSIDEERIQEYINRVGIYWTEDLSNLIVYFSCAFNGNADQLNKYFQPMILPGESINKCSCRGMLSCGNRTTYEYWFKKLNRNEKVQVLTEEECREGVLTNIHSRDTNLMYYLLLMNEKQREDMIRKYTKEVVRCLLHWPMQSLFMEAAMRGWQLMNATDCFKVLYVISDKICCGYRDYDYCQLFTECWSLNPDDYKKQFLSDNYYVCGLIRTKKEEIMKLVLNEWPADQLLVLFNKYDDIKRVLMDESVIPDAALVECKDEAALNSWNDQQNMKKRLRSEQLSRFVDLVMECRIEK